MKTHIPVSLQLWSIRDSIQEDFEKTIQSVAKMGYDGVETAGYGDMDCASAAKAIRDSGMKCSGMHVSLEDLRSKTYRIIEEAVMLQCNNVICPYIAPAILVSEAAYDRIGHELRQLGAIFYDFGIQLHYHNHDFELASFEGKTGLQTLLEASPARLLKHEVDLYWMHKAGIDLQDYLSEQKSRIRLLHLKNETELAEGAINYPALLQFIEKNLHIDWLVIEVENYTMPPIRSVEVSIQDLRTWMG